MEDTSLKPWKLLMALTALFALLLSSSAFARAGGSGGFKGRGFSRPFKINPVHKTDYRRTTGQSHLFLVPMILFGSHKPRTPDYLPVSIMYTYSNRASVDIDKLESAW